MQRQQDALGEPVLQRRIDVVGQVLLQHLHVGVHRAVGELAVGQREGRLRVEDRESRVGVLREEEQFFGRRLARDDRAAVHLRAGAGQGEHRAQRQGIANERPVAQEVPGFVARVLGGGRDELGAVDDRPAAGRQQEIDPFRFDLGDGLHAGFIAGIRLDAAELDDATAFQRQNDLIVNAVPPDRPAPEGQHDLGLFGDEVLDLGNGSLAEDDPGGVVIREVQHVVFLSSCSQREMHPSWQLILRRQAASANWGQCRVFCLQFWPI